MQSTAVGEIEKHGRVLIIRRIHVTYRLTIDDDVDPAAVDRVHGFHAEHCPVYRSLHPQIHITTSYELIEGGT